MYHSNMGIQVYNLNTLHKGHNIQQHILNN